MALNTMSEKKCWDVFQTESILEPSTPKWDLTGNKPKKWCKYHKVKGHHSDDCHQFMNEIEHLIQEEDLRRYVQGTSYSSKTRTRPYGRDSWAMVKKYSTCLANMVMVKKFSCKWWMCIDFSDLNLACLKDLYHFPIIDILISCHQDTIFVVSYTLSWDIIRYK